MIVLLTGGREVTVQLWVVALFAVGAAYGLVKIALGVWNFVRSEMGRYESLDLKQQPGPDKPGDRRDREG